MAWPVPGCIYALSRWPEYSTFFVYIPSLFVLNNSKTNSKFNQQAYCTLQYFFKGLFVLQIHVSDKGVNKEYTLIMYMQLADQLTCIYL